MEEAADAAAEGAEGVGEAAAEEEECVAKTPRLPESVSYTHEEEEVSSEGERVRLGALIHEVASPPPPPPPPQCFSPKSLYKLAWGVTQL